MLKKEETGSTEKYPWLDNSDERKYAREKTKKKEIYCMSTRMHLV